MILKELASQYIIARRRKEQWTKEADRLKDDLALALKTQGLDRIACDVEDGGLVTEAVLTLSDPRCFASCAQDNFLKLKRWLKKRNLQGIIKAGVHPATLSSAISEEIKMGTEIPAFINVHWEPVINVPKGLSAPVQTAEAKL